MPARPTTAAVFSVAAKSVFARWTGLALLAALIAFVGPHQSHAQGFDGSDFGMSSGFGESGFGGGLTDPAVVTPVSEHTTIAPGQTIWVGLHFDMQPGWHIYWTNPAGPGFPPSVKWTLPDGLTAGDIHWPAPHGFDFAGETQFGYEEQTTLLVPITASDDLAAGQTLSLKAAADWLVCKDSCLPGNQTVTFELTSVDTAEPATPNAHITEARDHLPQPAAEVLGQPVTFSTEGSTVTFQLPGLAALIQTDADAETLQNAIHLYPRDTVAVPVNQPNNNPLQIATENGAVTLTTALSTTAEPDAIKAALSPFSGVLVVSKAVTLNGHDLVLEMEVNPLDESAVANVGKVALVAQTPKQLLALTGAALLGGIILNLMPCVFPVLSLKIMGFVQQAGEDRMKIKVHGLVFGAGVLVSFWALVGVLLSLRAGGEQLGWGYQLSSPGFVLALLLMLFVLGLSLSGLFEIGTSFTRLGGAAAHQTGLAASFLSGVLATVVATPCTGPFMGPALGVALTTPAWQALVIFTGLAVGVALPYVVLSFNPKLLRFLPRPGAWMETFKKVMAFPLYATCAWLAWVYVSLTHQSMVMLLGFGLTALAFGGWLYGSLALPHLSTGKQWTGRLLGVLGLAACIWLALTPAPKQWEHYSEDTLASLRQENRPILVDFTATWCATCQVNKKTTLRTEAAEALYQQHNVALLEGDMTKQSPEILAALEKHGRSSVPLYLVYPADPDAEPIVLDNILTPGLLQDAIEQASAPGNGPRK